MPRKKKVAMATEATLPQIPSEWLDRVFVPMTEEAVERVMMGFKKAVIERALGAEISHHPSYGPSAVKPEQLTNHRNGTCGKTVLTGDGPLRIEVPRDSHGSFVPQFIGKHERRFTVFDDKIVGMYACGMTVREIQGFLVEMYGVEISSEFISSVTDAVMAEITAWQDRPLEMMYSVVFFDALQVKSRENAVVRSKAVYRVLGIPPDGTLRRRGRASSVRIPPSRFRRGRSAP